MNKAALLRHDQAWLGTIMPVHALLKHDFIGSSLPNSREAQSCSAISA